jgi:acyl-CoA thioester hydrolase
VTGGIWPFRHERVVEYGDLDAMRHVNNVVFARWFETARLGCLAEIAPGIDVADAGRHGLILASIAINYRAPVGFGEEVVVEVRPAEVGRTSFRLDYDVASRTEDRVVADGHTVSVTYDYVDERPIDVPAELREKLASGVE